MSNPGGQRQIKIGVGTGLIITVTKSGTGYIAECKNPDIFGNGDSVVEAISDLAEFMKEDYVLLLHHKEHLTKYAENKLKQHQLGDDNK